jgi:hypothetical protein
MQYRNYHSPQPSQAFAYATLLELPSQLPLKEKQVIQQPPADPSHEHSGLVFATAKGT